MRPTSDKNRQCPSREYAWAVFRLRRLFEPAHVLGAQQCIPVGPSSDCLRASHLREGRWKQMQAPARGILEEEEAIFCLGLLGVPSVGTVLGRNCAQPEPWDTGRAVSSNLNVNQLDKLNHSHFLASISAPKHLSSYHLFLLSLSP